MQYTTKILPNGLHVLYSPKPGTKAVTVMAFIKVGSRYEKLSQAGISHMTEHLLFKGTNKRPSTLHIAKELDTIGASYNAFTTKEYTGLYVKTDVRHTELACDVVADMLFGSKFDKQEMEKERAVIIEEINMYEDSPMDSVDWMYEQKLYGMHPLASPIIGDHKTVGSIRQQDIRQFHKKYYQPHNIVLSISGNITDSCSLYVEKYFGKKVAKQKIAEPETMSSLPRSIKESKYKQTEQVHLMYGLPVKIKRGHKDYEPLKIANIIFGGSMSSRLFINIREKQGLGYYVYSDINAYQDTANWAIAAGVDRGRAPEAVNLLTKEWARLLKGVTKTEVEQAKSNYIGRLALQQEDSAQTAQWYAKQAVYGLPLKTPEEVQAIIQNVSYQQVNTIIQKYLSLQRLSLVLIGPFKDMTAFAA